MTQNSSNKWTLNDIDWEAFQADKVDSDLLCVVKTAALVEYNAESYVDYLVNIFSDHPSIQNQMREWGREEEQHGEALARWALLADPDFDFEQASERFKSIYQANAGAQESVRGSLGGEMISRCVVESATAFFYTAMKENAQEPVLKQIAGNIAKDEFAHYQLFLKTLESLPNKPSVFSLLKTAIGRVGEVGDDELASAYFAANRALFPDRDYDMKVFGAAYTSKALGLYTEQHAKRMSSMIARALGLKPYGRIMRTLHPLIWQAWNHNVKRQSRISRKAQLA